MVAFHLEGAYKQEGDQYFRLSDSDRAGTSGFKRKDRFRLDVREKYFVARVVLHTLRAVGAPSLEALKPVSDGALGNLS